MLVCSSITAFVAPPGTGKRETSLALIALTYFVPNDISRSKIQFERIRQQWREGKFLTGKLVLSVMSVGPKLLHVKYFTARAD